MVVAIIFLILISPCITGTQTQSASINPGSGQENGTARQIETGSQSGLVGQGPGQIQPVPIKGVAGQAGTTSQAGTSGLTGPVYPGPTTTINFDDIVTVGASGGGATPVTDQYASKGVTFNGARAVDFSKGMAIPGFTHSGNIAIEACYGAELCTDPIEMNFDQPQSSVTVWVGIDTQSTAKQEYVVELSAFGSTGQQVANNYAVLNAVTGPAPIQTRLQVSGSNIVRATVSYIVRAVGYVPPSTYNSGLAIDDVEFFSRIGVTGTKNSL